jgi:hypothetical protein
VRPFPPPGRGSPSPSRPIPPCKGSCSPWRSSSAVVPSCFPQDSARSTTLPLFWPRMASSLSPVWQPS